MNLFVFFAVFAQLAFSIAIVGFDDQDDLIMDSNEGFLLDRIDLNSLDIIEAKKEDTVRVPIRQLRQLLKLAIKEDRMKRRETAKSRESGRESGSRENISRESRKQRRLTSALPANRPRSSLPVLFDLREDIYKE